MEKLLNRKIPLPFVMPSSAENVYFINVDIDSTNNIRIVCWEKYYEANSNLVIESDSSCNAAKYISKKK